MSSVLNDPALEGLLNRLHSRSDAQRDELDAYVKGRLEAGTLAQSSSYDEERHRFLSDKLVALDRDKAEFCYLLCRSLGAARVVEAGTSFGVSTLYLAAAVRDNGVSNGLVIGTEYEPEKARIARTNFEEAGLSEFIELREGDLRETLQGVDGPVDFVLIDIWEVALPALRLVAPSLRPGAMVVCDNTAAHPDYYRHYFDFINDPRNRFRTMTLPFDGGLELTVRV